MRIQDFHQSLEKGDILPLYYFYGPEKRLLQEALRRLEEKILKPGTREFNRGIVDAEEEEIQTILDQIHTLPWGASRRLLVVRQADVIWKNPPSFLISYLEDPNPSTCTVFWGEKADLRTKFFQTFEKKGGIVGFFPPSPKEILGWMRDQARQAGHALSEDAASLLLEMVGPSLLELREEIQKIVSSLPKGKRIEMADIENLTEKTRLESPFELPKSIARLDLQATLHVFRKNWQQGESAPLLLALILRHLRLVGKAQQMKSAGVSTREIESRLHILPREASHFWEQVRRSSSVSWEEVWKISLEADRAMKSSRGDKGLLLEEYLWSLLRLESQKGIPADRN